MTFFMSDFDAHAKYDVQPDSVTIHSNNIVYMKGNTMNLMKTNNRPLHIHRYG